VQRCLDNLIFPIPSPALSRELIIQSTGTVCRFPTRLFDRAITGAVPCPGCRKFLDSRGNLQSAGRWLNVRQMSESCSRIRQTTGYHSQDVDFVQLSFGNSSFERRHSTDVSTWWHSCIQTWVGRCLHLWPVLELLRKRMGQFFEPLALMWMRFVLLVWRDNVAFFNGF